MRRRLFYGWVVVAAAFASHFLHYGLLTVAFGVLFPFMAEALHLGRGVLSSAWAALRLVSAAIASPVGAAVDRHGPRRWIALGAASLAAGALVLAAAGDAWRVFLGYGLLMALGNVVLGEVTADATVARWFVRRRSRALALATMGLSTAGIVVPLPVALVVTRWGWRAAWVALGAGALAVGLAVALVTRRSPEDLGLRPDGEPPARDAGAPAAVLSFSARQATRTPAFWLLVVSTNLGGLALFGINIHLFSYVTDKGVAVGPAAALVTYLYLLHTVAKPLWGLIAERLHVRYCIAGCYLGGGLGVGLLLVATSPLGLVAFATVYGLTRGAQSFVTSLAWADYFGRDAGGAIRGVAAVFRFAASASGPVLGGVLYDLAGDCALAFGAYAAAFVAGALIALAARPPGPSYNRRHA
jgi:MFS family permease